MTITNRIVDRKLDEGLLNDQAWPFLGGMAVYDYIDSSNSKYPSR